MKPAPPQSAREGPGPPGSGPPPGPRREPGPARPRPDTAGDRPHRTGPGGARPSPAPPGPRSPPPHRPRPLPPLLARKARLPQVVPGTFSSGPLRSAPLPAFPSPRITLFLLFPNDLQWRVKSRTDQQPDASNRMSFPPVSRDFSAGFGDEGEGRGPRVGDRCPGPRAFVDEEPGPRVPKPGMKPLLRRGGGRGLPWTRGRLGDGAGHRAPQPCRRPPPGGESYATRRTWGFSWRAPGRGPGNETHSCNDGRAARRGRDPERFGSWTVQGGRWRSGRIVPPRTRSRCRRNRGITRKSPGASEVPVRTILPERQNQVPPGFPAPAARSAGCPTGAWPAPAATRLRGPVTGSCLAAP